MSVVIAKSDLNYIGQATITGCDTSTIISWFVNVQKDLSNEFQSQLNKIVESYVGDYNIPQQFSPMPGMYVIYELTNMIFNASNSIVMTADASLLVEVSDGASGKINITFDASAVESSIVLPTDWANVAINDSVFNFYFYFFYFLFLNKKKEFSFNERIET